MNTICVCGAGTMGAGIAQVAASAEFQTILFDVNENVLANAASQLQNTLSSLVDKGRITTEKKDNILAAIHFTSDINECTADVVIEAIVERIDIKQQLFTQLEQINAPEAFFASNTSSLSISDIASALQHPGRFAGLHFFNPAPLMKLVEVVKGERTTDTVIDSLTDLVKRLGKQPVVCKDSPGFIVNRVARPFYIESLRLAEEGVTFSDIDELLTARGFKMGPFKLMDLIGNDVNYAVSCSVYDQLQQPERLRPSDIQKKKVDAGELGKKTGKGYYDY